MAIVIRNKHATPVTLPFPFRGILAEGAGVLLDMTEAQALVALAIAGVDMRSGILALERSNATSGFNDIFRGNALNGLMITELNNITGEANTASNVGAGLGIWKQKTGVDLEFLSLVGAANISITPVGNTLEIAATSDDVIVKSEADLPAASGGKIQLANSTAYKFIGTVTLSNILVPGTNNVLYGRGPSLDTIVSMASTLLEVPASANSLLIQNLSLANPMGQVFDVQNPTFVTVEVAGIVGKTIGTFQIAQNLSFFKCDFSGFETGLTFTGANGGLTMGNCGVKQTTGGAGNGCIDFAAAVMASVQIDSVGFVSDTGGFSIKGAAASANIATGGRALVNHTTLNGTGGTLSGITTDDLLWRFTGMFGVLDSKISGSFTQNAGTDSTVVAAATPIKLVLNTTAGSLRRYTAPVSNRLVYKSLQDRKQVVAMCMAIAKTGGSVLADIGIAVNDVIVARIADIEIGTNPENLACTVELPTAIETDQYIELWIESASAFTAIISGVSVIARS